MKLLFSILFLAFIGLTACEKADVVEQTHNALPCIVVPLKVLPGVHFTLPSGHTGWLDPEIVEGDLDPSVIYEEPASMSGYKYFLNGHEGIACPTTGNTCGRLYIIDEGGVTFIGLYLC